MQAPAGTAFLRSPHSPCGHLTCPLDQVISAWLTMMRPGDSGRSGYFVPLSLEVYNRRASGCQAGFTFSGGRRSVSIRAPDPGGIFAFTRRCMPGTPELLSCPENARQNGCSGEFRGRSRGTAHDTRICRPQPGQRRWRKIRLVTCDGEAIVTRDVSSAGSVKAGQAGGGRPEPTGARTARPRRLNRLPDPQRRAGPFRRPIRDCPPEWPRGLDHVA